jgi:methylmalonyl-CoA mutase cobalamin-binding subunit
MTSTRRIVAAVGLAVGVTGLAAPLASAADAAAPSSGRLNPVSTLDSLVVSGIPAEHKADIPQVAPQLAQLRRVNDLNQLQQLTGLVAPVTGLLPGIR